jgi:hypothetical protein
MCTREAALRRLIGRWICAVIDTPEVAHTMPLKALLTEANIEATRALNLYEGYDDLGDRQRGRALIEAWQAQPTARVQ